MGALGEIVKKNMESLSEGDAKNGSLQPDIRITSGRRVPPGHYPSVEITELQMRIQHLIFIFKF